MPRVITYMILMLPALIAEAERWVVRDSVLTVSRDVVEIEAYGFADRTDLREVRFEQGSQLKTIGEYAFLGCSNLRYMNLPASLETIGEGSFRECALKELDIPRRVKALPKAMCAWNLRLESVILPDGLTDIGSHAFAYCCNLRVMDIPISVTHIGSNAFSRCGSLEEIVLPAGMKELESYAFSDCISLKRAVMPANAGLLGELIFSGCMNMRELTVMSLTPPPFDCNSSIFEPDEIALYRDCRLHVPASSVEKYRRAPGWKLFQNIGLSGY